METLSRIFNSFILLMGLAFYGGVIDDLTRYFAEEATKSHQVGLMSLSDWNEKLVDKEEPRPTK